jgi:hypothetical protein
MALGKSRVKISARGRGITLKAYEVASAGSQATMTDLGYITSVEFSDDPGTVEHVDAAGDMVQTNEGQRKVTLKAVLKQSSADEIGLMTGAADKFYHVYLLIKEDNPTVTWQEIYIPLAKITSALALAYQAGTERTIECIFTALMPKGAVTVVPAGLSVAAGLYYVLVDTATTALGQVTSTNGTVYTAAV